MKHQLLAQVLTGFAIAVTTIAIPSKPSNAQTASFYCGQTKYQGKLVPTTMVQTPRGDIPIIRWVTKFINPQTRCQQVSENFQKNLDNGTLAYIKHGKMNGQNVVCGARNPKDTCRQQTLLFTLRAGVNPQATVQKLMNIGSLASNPLNQSTCKKDCPINPVDILLRETDCKKNCGIYIDFKKFLEKAPVEQKNSSEG